MQEEVEQKTMALSVRTARLTAELLQKAFRQFFEAQKNKPQELSLPTIRPFTYFSILSGSCSSLRRASNAYEKVRCSLQAHKKETSQPVA